LNEVDDIKFSEISLEFRNQQPIIFSQWPSVLGQ